MAPLAQTNKLKQQRTPTIVFVFILGSLTDLSPLSIDMYLSASLVVANNLETTASLTQLSITTCLLGLALGQIIFGPLSDMKGRRKPLIITILFYVIFSILCALSSHIFLFIIGRFLQGFTGAAGIVIARAAARDLYSGKELTKFMALLAIVMGAAPILSPVFGGIILKWISWQAVFYVLAGIGVLLFLSVLFLLPETLEEEDRLQGDAFVAIKSFGQLFRDRIFVGIAFSQAFISMGMFAYIAASPFVLQKIYAVSPQQYSFIFALNGLGIIIFAQIAGRIVTRVKEETIMFIAILIAFFGGILLLFVVFFELHISVMIIALFTVVSVVGLINTTSFSLAMSRQGHIAGSASAFLGILPFAGGALVSPLTGILGENNMIPMGLVIFCCSLCALIIFLLFVKNKVQ